MTAFTAEEAAAIVEAERERARHFPAFTLTEVEKLVADQSATWKVAAFQMSREAFVAGYRIARPEADIITAQAEADKAIVWDPAAVR